MGGFYIRTPEHKKKMSEKLMGHVSWWKGKKLSETHKENMRKNRIGIKPYTMTDETRKKISIAGKGRKQSIETRKKIGEKQKGEKNHAWKGGISPIQQIIRGSLEYKLWREAVFERDDWTCMWCGARNGNGKAVILQADHIKPFSLYPELRFAIDNGRTLCVPCHKTTVTYGGKALKIKI